MKKVIVTSLAMFLLVACNGRPPEAPVTGPGMGMRHDGMGTRHHAQIPKEYAGMVSPEITTAMLTRGAEIYAASCASCHGVTGFGDGPAASALDPAPAPVAHTSRILGDAYLFWRTSEGGVPFGTAMPGWKGILSDEEIWSVIAYMRALGGGQSAEDFQDQQHGEMLSDAIDQNLITQAEADTFLLVHAALDAYWEEHRDDLSPGGMDEHQETMLAALVDSGKISKSQADDFARIHQLLLDAGLMQ
ncbi:MAG: hypothetical protein Kow002_14240 [Anaerolineales bacterium]